MPLRPFSLTILLLASTATLSAQTVEEPPIPVMIVCPYHEDSLRRAYESEIMVDGQQRHQLDSISLSAIQAASDMSAQMERSFTFLYLLLALLALTSLAALRVAYRLRSELEDLRRSQHMPALALPAPVVVNTSPLRRPRRKSAKPKPTRRSSSDTRSTRRPRSRR
jgi:hypothetical protein